MNRTYSRGSTLYKVSGRWPRYDVAVSCDCDAGTHWHHLYRVRSADAAEQAIAVHAVSVDGYRAFGETVAT